MSLLTRREQTTQNATGNIYNVTKTDFFVQLASSDSNINMSNCQEISPQITNAVIRYLSHMWGNDLAMRSVQ